MATLEQRNKAIVQKYFDEYWGKANPDIVDVLCTEDFLIKYPMHGPRHGREGAKKMMREFKEAFPNISFEAYGAPLIAEGDYVAARWVGGGVHTGLAFSDLAVGELSKANTGKKIEFSGTSIIKLKDGKIQYDIGEEGALTALQQLGLAPPSNPGKEVVYNEKRGAAVNA